MNMAHPGQLPCWLLLVLFISTHPALAQPQANPAALSTVQTEALKPLTCPACIETSQLRFFRLNKPPSVIPTEKEILDGYGLVARGDVVVKQDHVCLGRHLTLAGKQPIGLLPDDDTPRFPSMDNITQSPYLPHPAKFEGICIGTLVALNEFLKMVVGTLFMDQLQKSEALLNAESLNKAIQANLVQALESTRAQMTAQVTADVLALLKGGGKSSAGPTPSENEPLACQMVAACDNNKVASEACCLCMVDGKTFLQGGCERRDGTWYLKKH
jgi:hypothetical protein